MSLFRRSRAYVQPAVFTATTTPHIYAYRLATTTASITTADEVLGADATSAAFTTTLPTSSGNSGRTFTIKRVSAGANAVTIATTSAQTIDGATTFTLSTQWQSVTVCSDGANWIIL